LDAVARRKQNVPRSKALRAGEVRFGYRDEV
jgi:hypothetical protein